jgi:phosphoenolpyruvate-protein kinase (PTS system EI component)
MSLPSRFSGLTVAEGTAAGVLLIADADADANNDDVSATAATADEVSAAFAAVAAERHALAARLRDAGREHEAGIIEIGALIAADPALTEPAVAAVRGGEPATVAVRAAAEEQAAIMAGLAIPELAERAGDIRQVAQAVLEHLGQRPTVSNPRPAGDFILVRREVSPADLIELAEAGLVGAVSVAGGASSHAAIIARGLGVPMLTGLDPAVLALPSGQPSVLNADEGELVVGTAPTARSAPDAATDAATDAPTEQQALAGPARTADGTEITVLCNVASAAETRRGLAAGAAGVGLLRTEIPYTRALAWPTMAEQEAQLTPILGLLTGRPATVRLLDFSGDKVPPFLPDTGTDGLTALLTHPAALADQLRAILKSGRDTTLAVLVPMVTTLAQVSQVRAALSEAAAELGADLPRLGIMVELQSTAEAALTFAPAVDFFSIGTNDLTSDVLHIGRTDPQAGPALAAHPRVLALIKHVAGASVPVSVCGDSAADPRVLPLLLGAGVRTLSVPAARVPRVRAWISQLDAATCADLTAQALTMESAAEVWTLVPEL